MRRVFQNLIGNALKYGAAGGWIGVSAGKSGADVRVVVADKGMGIARQTRHVSSSRSTAAAMRSMLAFRVRASASVSFSGSSKSMADESL